MSMILHDYRCLAHGAFESADGRCPKGCAAAFVEKVFLKPPGYHSDGTKNIDRNLRALAADFNLTDMNNHGGTTAAVTPDWRALRAQEEMQRAILAGQTMAVPIAEGKAGVTQTMQGLGTQGDNALARVREALPKPQPIVHAAYKPDRMPEAAP